MLSRSRNWLFPIMAEPTKANHILQSIPTKMYKRFPPNDDFQNKTKRREESAAAKCDFPTAKSSRRRYIGGEATRGLKASSVSARALPLPLFKKIIQAKNARAVTTTRYEALINPLLPRAAEEEITFVIPSFKVSPGCAVSRFSGL